MDTYSITIDQVIALAASVGACISAIAAFLAVRQNAKQREASYKPELVITETRFTASKDPLSKGSFAEFWVEKPKETDSENDVLLPSFSLRLHNLGLGAAREVTLKWSFQIDKLVTTINDKAQRLLIPAYFKFENDVLSLQSKQLDASTSMWKNQKNAAVDFVLPASIDQSGVSIKIPHAYIELVSALLFFSSKEKNQYSFLDIPKLDIKLEYFDIGGAKYSASFAIELNLVAIYGNGEGFHGYLQSKKMRNRPNSQA